MSTFAEQLAEARAETRAAAATERLRVFALPLDDVLDEVREGRRLRLQRELSEIRARVAQFELIPVEEEKEKPTPTPRRRYVPRWNASYTNNWRPPR